MNGYEKGYFLGKFEWMSPIQVAFYRFPDNFNNGPIWFLIALFNAYMLYMAIWAISKDKVLLKCILSLLVGVCGYLSINYFKLKIPFYIDMAAYATPFIFVGEMIRVKTQLLTPNKYDKWNIAISVMIFIVMIFTTPNSYEQKPSIAQYYFNGVCGTIAILLLCKQIRYIPVISYIGRYSIIVLGLHALLIGKPYSFFLSLFHNVYIAESLTLVVVIFICVLAIIVLKKYLPWFVAQKDAFIFVEPRR